MAIEMVGQGHLGGYIKGGDPATWFPTLWEFAVREFNLKSVFDLGCGEGHSLKYFREVLGMEVIGFDGIEQEDRDIYPVDFEQDYFGKTVPTPWPVDLTWTCEFLEHVEERYLVNVAPSLRMSKWVMMTHAFPGQAGHHHVNCREPEYWKGWFAGIGFEFMPELTQVTRSVASLNTDPNNHYLRSGMVFKKRIGV